MTQPLDPKTSLSKASRMAAALTGGKRQPAAPRTDDAFDREVDEEMQREWFGQIWERYSGLILGAAVAVVLGVGIYKLIENRREVAAEAAGTRYASALKDLAGDKSEQGAQALAAIAKAGGGFATLARLQLAATAVAAGKTADAVAQYDLLAQERGVDPVLAQYARLQTAMLSLDSMSVDEMQSRIAPLLSDKSAWRHNAHELIGMALMKAGKIAEARAQFEPLATEQGVAAGIAERARIVMGSIVAAELAGKGLAAPAGIGVEPAKASAGAASTPVDAPPAAPTSADPTPKK